MPRNASELSHTPAAAAAEPKHGTRIAAGMVNTFAKETLDASRKLTSANVASNCDA